MRDFLHRHVWQSLPRSARRALFFASTRTLAPPISAGAIPCEPIIVAGSFRAATGLGQSARLCYEAFLASGINVCAVDLTAALGQPIDYPNYTIVDGRHLTGAGTLILHVNSPFVPFALLRLGRPFIEGKWVIGFWHWELPRAAPDLQHGVSRVHEIWTPSQFTATAIRGISKGKTVRVLPHPVALAFRDEPRKVDTRGSSITALCAFNMASGFVRKNPLASIAAFKAAFGNNPKARLLLKVSHAQSYPDGRRAILAAIGDMPNVTLIDRLVDEEAMNSLFDQTDVVMSLHRSEGFGLVVAEAMLNSVPALSTDWSGTTDFLTTVTGVPIKYRLIPAIDPQGDYDQPSQLWADANIEDAAMKLSQLRDPAIRQAIGEAARADAVKRFSAKAYVECALEYIKRPLQLVS